MPTVPNGAPKRRRASRVMARHVAERPAGGPIAVPPVMYRCRTCETFKPADLFVAGKPGRCKACHLVAQRGWSERRGGQPYRRDRYERRRAVLEEIKSRPCADCGGSFPPYVMDLDHRDPSEKVAPVSQLINAGEAAIRAEAAKCDVVCANCHRIRTFERKYRRIS